MELLQNSPLLSWCFEKKKLEPKEGRYSSKGDIFVDIVFNILLCHNQTITQRNRNITFTII